LGDILTGIFGDLKGEKQKIASSFSTEDLVSDLLTFYATVDNTTIKALVGADGGRFAEQHEKLLSRAIWNFGLQPSPGTATWTPQYFDYDKFMAPGSLIGGGYTGDYTKYMDYNKARELLPQYKEKSGTPTMPKELQKYTADCDGVCVLEAVNK